MISSDTNVTMLVILDGFGWKEPAKDNAIYHAKTPNFDRFMKEYPHAILRASGLAVGLPENNIGNSEVGHMTIGAGRIIDSPIVAIDKKIADGSFFSNPALVQMLERVKKNGGTVHIMGLLSDAGVHASLDHLRAFIQAAHDHGITHIIIHPFLDGRDTPPRMAKQLLNKMETIIAGTGAHVGSLHGRYFAMDRDTHWDRIEKSYRTLTEPQNAQFNNWQNAIDHYYAQDLSDEFIPPTQLDPHAIIKDGDGIIFFNFRADRARQLTSCFVDPQFDAFTIKQLKLNGFVTPTDYDAGLETDVMSSPQIVTNTLTKVLAAHDKTIFSIAETEKYAHVTYFFNGGQEEPVSTETRILIPSKPEEYRDLSPCMQAPAITDAVINSLEKDPADFYLINYANSDIIGHTGDFEKIVKAVACVDKQIGALYHEVVEKRNGTLYITADHGNAEDTYDEQARQPRTAHTTNPVPFLWICNKEKGHNIKLPLSQLSDIAPFILEHMGIGVPKEMQSHHEE